MQLTLLNAFVAVSIGVLFSPADLESAGTFWQLHPHARKSATNCSNRCFESTPLSQRQQRIPRSSHQQHGLASDHSTNGFDGTLLSKEKANTPQSQVNFSPQVPKFPHRIVQPYLSAGRPSSGPVEKFSKTYPAIGEAGYGATPQTKLPRNSVYFPVSSSSDSKTMYHNSNAVPFRQSELQSLKRNLRSQYVNANHETVVHNGMYQYTESVPASSMLTTLSHLSDSFTGTNANYFRICCRLKKSPAYWCFRRYCDDLCPIFGDCCDDYNQLYLGQNITQQKTWEKTETTPKMERKILNLTSRLGCVKMVLDGCKDFYFRAVNSCDDKIRDRQAMNRKLCEDVTVHPNITSIPFPLLSNRAIIFKNVYCAFCNGIHQSELDVSNAVIFYECDHIETNDFNRWLSQAVDTGMCKRTLNSNISSLLRACPLPDPTIENTAELCHRKFKPNLLHAPGGPLVFQVHFQLTNNSWGYGVNGKVFSPPVVTCPDDQVYIPYYNDCEPLSCEPHTYPFRGRCLIEDRLIAESSLQPLPNGTSRYTLILRLQPWQGLRSEDSLTMEEAAREVKQKYTYVLRNQSIDVEGSKLVRSGMDIVEDRIRMSVRIDITVNNASLQDVLLMSKTLENFTDVNKPSSLFELHSIVVSDMSNIPEGWKCPNGSLRAHSNLTLVTDDAKRYFARHWTTYYELENIGFELQTLPEKNFTPVLLNCLVCESSTLIHCDGKGYVHLNATMFILSNDTLIVKPDGDVFNKSEFVVFDNGSAIVCSIYNSTYVQKVSRHVMRKYYGPVTITILTTSIICLFIVLIIYSILPQLRNVPGVIIMSYSGSLMGFQLLNLTDTLPHGWLCVLHACLFHGMMLSSFLWKSMLSFDLVFMMGLNSVKNSSHAQRALMLNCYSVVSWVLPVVIVLLFWLLDFFQVFVIQYGSWIQGVCWVARPWFDTFLIMTPLGLTWLFNSACLILALCRIRQSGRLTQTAVQSRNKGLTTRNRLLVCFRIGLLLDCTWVIYFLAVTLDVHQLWVAHTILNGSQGVYILLCFVAKRRVWGMMRDRLGVKKKGPTSNNATSNSDNNIGRSIAKSTISAQTPQSASLHSTLEGR